MASGSSVDSSRTGLSGPLLLPLGLLGIVAVALLIGLRWLPQRRHESPQPRAFYYWKTQWGSSPAIAQSLTDNGINRLYLRFFDVDWAESEQGGQPVSPLQLGAPLPTAVEVIPVVFVTNRVFLATPAAAIDELAAHVLQKVDRMAAADGITVHELQLDCDWSERSRSRYFRFLSALGQKLHARQQRLSSTIRLHQVKYPQRTGVPPVDRGMLMFYNFGPLRADAPRSSIYNAEDAGRYAAYVASYSLPLDLALPIFSWSVHSREGAVQGLLEKLEPSELVATGAFRALGGGRFEAARALFFRSHYFMAGDELRMEEMTPLLTRQAATVAAQGASPNRRYGTIAFFDLDERNLRHYAPRDFQAIFDLLR